MNRQSAIFFILFSGLLFSSCKDYKVEEPKAPGKILVLCDDYNVDNWYAYLDSFDKYQIKLTLYVSNFHHFTPQQIGKLRAFQNRFDDIGFHTLNHPTYAINTVDTAYINQYLLEEIDLGIERMRTEGFYPTAFAFPGDVHNQQIFDSLKTRFRYVRQGSIGFFDFWKRHKDYNLTPKLKDHFYTYFLENASLFKMDETVDMIKEDLRNGKNISFCIHSLTEDNFPFTTSPTQFFALIRSLQETQARYVTVSEFFQ